MSDANVGETKETVVIQCNDESVFDDKPITCIDCAREFIWTVGEQIFFRDKRLQNPPKRCRPCKKMKNERLAAIDLAQTTGLKQRIEVAAECARCAVVTTVPFYPSQGRPVYCRACFLEVTSAPNGRQR